MVVKTMSRLELADAIAALQKALADREAAKELLAESEKVVKEVTIRIKSTHPEFIKHFLNGHAEKTSKRTSSTRLSRSVWAQPTIDFVKGSRVPVSAPAVKKHFKLTGNIALQRLHSLTAEGILQMTKPDGKHPVFTVGKP